MTPTAVYQASHIKRARSTKAEVEDRRLELRLIVRTMKPSLSFLHSSAEYIAALDVPVHIYHLGDYDPSGVNAGEKIEQTLREMAPEADITFTRLAVTPTQIEIWELPTRLTKASDTRAKNFGDIISVELDAMAPDDLRALVESAINEHLPQDQLRILKIAEEDERRLLAMWARDAQQ